MQNQVLAISVDAREPLPEQFADELSRVGPLDDSWVECLDGLDDLWFGTQQHFF